MKYVIQREFVSVNIKNDNQGAIVLVKNPVKYMKLKHIHIRYHSIHNYYQLYTCNQMKTWLMHLRNLAENLRYKNLRINYLVQDLIYKGLWVHVRVLMHDSAVDNHLHFGLCLLSGLSLCFWLSYRHKIN